MPLLRKRTLCEAQWVRNSSLWVDSSPTRSEQGAVVRVATGGGAQHGDDLAGGPFPVEVEGGGARVQEHEPGGVHGPGRGDEHLRVQRVAERVAGEDVEPVVADERGATGDRVEDLLHRGTHLLLGAARAARGKDGLRGAGQVEQVRALGVVELQRAGERVEHAVGDAAHVAALQARVVRDADAGQHGHLLAPQAGHAARPVGRQPGLLRADPPAARGQELADL